MIYMDNAATSWPKPPEVIHAVVRCMKNTEQSRPVRPQDGCAGRPDPSLRREMLCVFNLRDPFQIIFTYNCTDALNLAIKAAYCPAIM